MYISSGAAAKAIALYEAFLSKQPENAELWTGLGKAYVSIGRPEEAKKCFEKALEIRPSAIEAQFGLQRLQSTERE